MALCPIFGVILHNPKNKMNKSPLKHTPPAIWAIFAPIEMPPQTIQRFQTLPINEIMVTIDANP